MVDKYIEGLNKLLTQEINNVTDLDVWKGSAINILNRIYGSNSPQEEQIKNIKYSVGVSYGGVRDGQHWSASGENNIVACREKAYSLTKNYIDELNLFGLPQPKKEKENEKILINLTQNQTQDIKINFNLVIQAFQNELNGKQLKEIQEIIADSKKNSEEKRSSIINKIKSFGSDVMSNILANMLTNPEIWNQF